MGERIAEAALNFAVLLAELAVLMLAVAVLLAFAARRLGWPGYVAGSAAGCCVARSKVSCSAS